MDNDKPETDARPFGVHEESRPKTSPLSGPGTASEAVEPRERGGLPVAEPFQAFSAIAPGERTGVFGQLVKGDTDIAGLVAYSIYKQNKLDWLTAFESEKGRAPNGDELASYIIGEGTPRRIATYRHLAEATLAGNGPAIGAAGQGPRPGFRAAGGFGDKVTLTPSLIATYGVIALLFLIGFLVAAHYTMSSR